MTRLLRLLIHSALLLCAAFRVTAADAAFSADGQRVYLVQWEKAAVRVLNVMEQTFSELDLGKFTNKQPVRAVSLATDGDMLFVTAHDAWAYKFETKSCVKLCNAGKGVEFFDLAHDPDSKATVLVSRKGAESGALYLKQDAAQPLPVFMRRVGSFDGLGFASDGTLFFGTRGDLWQGRVEPDQEMPRAVLEGIRCAPLATLETALGTPSQIGVQAVAVAGEKIYVHLRRLGGSGWGNIVRLNKPAAAGEDSLEARLKLYAAELSSVEVLAENGSASYLCASRDGKRVFFTSGTLESSELKYFLVEENGQPRELSVGAAKQEK